jgi:hypothetical protein
VRVKRYRAGIVASDNGGEHLIPAAHILIGKYCAVGRFFQRLAAGAHQPFELGALIEQGNDLGAQLGDDDGSQGFIFE